MIQLLQSMDRINKPQMMLDPSMIKTMSDIGSKYRAMNSQQGQQNPQSLGSPPLPPQRPPEFMNNGSQGGLLGGMPLDITPPDQNNMFSNLFGNNAPQMGQNSQIPLGLLSLLGFGG